MEIAVIIPCYNDAASLHNCLKALKKQSLEENRYHIYVVDNGSEQPIGDVVSLYSNTTLLIENKPGSYSARNKGIKSVDAKIYAFTDADCIPDSTWLECAATALKGQEADAITGPISVFMADKNNPTPFELIDVFSGFRQCESVNTFKYSPTANLIVPSNTFRKIGYFNDALFSGGDKDWCQRLYKSGGKLVYNEKVSIAHPARSTGHQHFTKIRRISHGMWARRKTDPTINLDFLYFFLFFIPPLSRWIKLFKTFPDESVSLKSRAAIYIYISKLYSRYQVMKCMLGLIREPERK